MEPSVREVFNSHLREYFDQILREAGDIDSEWPNVRQRSGHESKNTGLGKVRGGHGGGLPVGLKEIMANHPALQELEAVLHQHCLQW